MASEIFIPGLPTSGTFYAIVRSLSLNQFWNGSAFENYLDAHWSTYNTISLSQLGTSGIYVGSFPNGITTTGKYNVVAYLRVGGTAALGDTYEGSTDFEWLGSSELSLAVHSLLVNGLVSENASVRDRVYDTNGNLTNYNIFSYNSAANAATDDGSTGIVHKWASVITYIGTVAQKQTTTRTL